MPTSRRIEQIAGLVVLALLTIGCFIVLRPFLAALVWALILSISTWPAFRWFEQKFGGRTTLAAAVMTVLLAIALLVPLTIVGDALAENVTLLAGKIRPMLEDGPPPAPPHWLAELPLAGPWLVDFWDEITVGGGAVLAALKQQIGPATEWVVRVGATLGRGVVDLTLSVVAAFFFFRDGVYGARRAKDVLERLAGPRAHHLIEVAENTLKGVVYGVLGTALAQATLNGIGLWAAGVPGALFLAVLTFFFSFIPPGAGVVWLPAAVWLFTNGETEWGIFMALWGFFVVSTIDNFLKPYFISRGSDLPLLLVILGIFGGIIAFGFLGVFLGPILLALAYFLIREWSPEEEVVAAAQAEAEKSPDSGTSAAS
jgi:predicted PurR-regulated permease PerM